MIVFSCEHCGSSLTVDTGRGGETLTCPHCGKTTTIPPPDPDPHSPTLPDMPVVEDEDQ